MTDEITENTNPGFTLNRPVSLTHVVLATLLSGGGAASAVSGADLFGKQKMLSEIQRLEYRIESIEEDVTDGEALLSNIYENIIALCDVTADADCTRFSPF